MPSAENIELSVAIDAGDTKAVLDNINKNIEKMANTAEHSASKMKKAGDTMGEFTKKALGLLSIGAVVGVLKKSADEASNSARAQLVLENALKKVGLKYKDLKNDIQEISKVNAVDDDDVKQMYAFAVSIGIPKQRLSEFVKTAYDFSAQTGKELSLAMRTISSDAIKGGAAWESLKNNVSGAGGAIADADGGIKRVNVSINDAYEKLGKALKPVLTVVLTLFMRLLDTYQKLPQPIAATTAVVGGLTIVLRALNMTNPFGWIAIAIAGLFALNETMKQTIITARGFDISKGGKISILSDEESLDNAKKTLKTLNDVLAKRKAVSDFEKKFGPINDVTIGEKTSKYGKDLVQNELKKYEALKSAASSEFLKLDGELQKAVRNDTGGKLANELKKGIVNAERSKAALSDYNNYQEGMSKAQNEIIDSLKKIDEALKEAEKLARKTFDGELLDHFLGKLSGLSGAVYQFGKALAEASNNQTGWAEQEAQIERLKQELEELRRIETSSASTPEQKNNAIQQASSKTGELDKLTKGLSSAKGGAAGVVLAVLQEIANRLYQLWESYDAEMKRLADSTLTYQKKAAYATEEAWESVITGLIKEIPILGEILSKYIEQIWKTDSEKRDEHLESLKSELSEFEHNIAMGRSQSYNEQISYYEDYLLKLKEQSAATEDIRAMEEKIAGLKKAQADEVQRQVDAAKELQRLESSLAGKNVNEQVSFWEKKKAELGKSITDMGPEVTQSQLDTYKSTYDANKTKWDEYNNRINDMEATYRQYEANYNRTGSGTWKNLMTVQRARIDKAYQDRYPYEVAWQNAQRLTNEAIAHNNALKEQNTLLADAELQLEGLEAESIRYNAQLFEHNLELSNATDIEKSKSRMEYYQKELEQMKTVNEKYNTEVEEAFDKLYEYRAGQLKAGRTEDQISNDAAYKTLEEELTLLEDKRFSEQEIWSMTENIADLEQSITDEKKAQTEEIKTQLGLLRDYGLLDVQNISQVRKSIQLMQQSGLSGSDILSQASSLGITNISNATGNSRSYYVNQINVNEAGGDTVSNAVNARMSRIFGGR